MSAKPKKKLCWNCEGNVSVKEVMCPYCGVSLHPSTSNGKEGQKENSNPPYKLVNPSHEHNIPLPPYARHIEVEEAEQSEETEPEDEDVQLKPPQAASGVEASKVIITLALLIWGSIFFIFSLALLLFSDEGYLTLRWDASFWFLYLLIGIPMLVFGWKSMQTLEGHDDET